MRKKPSAPTRSEYVKKRPLAQVTTTVGCCDCATNSVFLSRRALGVPRNAGRWELPGGGLDKDLSILKALRRELHEELGVSFRGSGPFFISESVRHYEDRVYHKEEGKKLHVHRHLAVVPGRKPSIRIPEKELKEHDGYAWVDASTYRDYPCVPGLKIFLHKIFAAGQKRDTLLDNFSVRNINIHTRLVDEGRVLIDFSHPENSYTVLGATETVVQAVRRQVRETFGISAIPGMLYARVATTWEPITDAVGDATLHVVISTTDPVLVDRISNNSNGVFMWDTDSYALTTLDMLIGAHEKEQEITSNVRGDIHQIMGVLNKHSPQVLRTWLSPLSHAA